jgi:TRAP-type mannitol/chloroaromatic compound transport system permease large subunit
MLSLEVMPPLMFGGLVVFLLIGFPVAFSLAGRAVLRLPVDRARLLHHGYLGNLPLRVFGIMSNDLLLSIPSSP